jgi:hypothetical protein
MSRKKKSPRNKFSAWEYIGNDVLNFLAKWKGRKGEVSGPLRGSQLYAVMVAAINFDAIIESIKDQETIELACVFAGVNAAKPKLTKALLSLIKRRWKGKPSVASIVARYLTVEYPKEWRDEFFKTGGVTNDKDESLLELVGKTIPAYNRRDNADAIKKARQRIRPPRMYLGITEELSDAIRQLRASGVFVP